jgi:trimethylamine--corrinoid protein Co-methyltransferase
LKLHAINQKSRIQDIIKGIHMAFGRLVLLSDDEIASVHETSLKILQQIGIKVLSKKVQSLLAENGAKIDAASSIVKIPSSLVEEAIRKAPKEIVLCGRNPKFDLKLPSKDFTFVATSGYATFMRDLETGEKRMTKTSDLRDFAILADYLDEVDFFDSIVAPTELPPSVQTVHSLAVSFECTEKHVLNRALNEKQAKWQIKLASAVVGDEEKLRKRPIFCSVNCPVSPLLFEEGSSEAMIELARAGIPVVPMSMALCGSTAPATIVGTLAIVNAENLAALAILQCSNSGAPMIYCAESTSPNMRTGDINYQAPELPLIAAGATQMARLYKLPCYTTSIGMDETPNDWESLIGASERFALIQLGRGDISAGLGSLENAESSALEQVILDVEAWEQAKAYLRRFKVDEETLGFDAISKVGPGGNFLGLKHTLEHFQKEIWLKKELAILSSTGGSLIERAKEKVKEILSTHVPPKLEEDIRREINQILRNCEKNML